MNVKQYLNNLPKDLSDLIYLARDIATDRKMPTCLVGGFVRDLILGVPNFDLDIVVQGDGFVFASEFAARLNARLITHPRFGTATLITPQKTKLDVATARSEIYPHPATLPVVTPGTIKEDLGRRDFTINALAIDLLQDNFGSLIDFYQGRQDLQTKIIRILHDLSFIDDPTRIIRAVRFEQRLRFRIEPHSLGLLKEAKRKGMLKKVSSHRLRDEIILILKEPLALDCVQRLNELVGFDFIHSHCKVNKASLRGFWAIKREVDWFGRNFPKRRNLDVWLMYFIILVSGLKQEELSCLCEEFALRRGEAKRIISYSRVSQTIASSLSKKDILPSQIYRILEPLSFEVILLLKAKYRNRILNLNIERFLKYYNGMRHYVSGKDLTKLGLRPGPDYKKILKRLLYLQLNGHIDSRQDALEWVTAKVEN